MRNTIYFRSNHFFIAAILLSLGTGCSDDQELIGIHYTPEAPQIEFAIEELRSSFSRKGFELQNAGHDHADIVLELAGSDGTITPEGFSIKKNDKKIVLTAIDEAGLMYGGLELAEQISIGGWNGTMETTQNPYMEMRGTKFNIPLDARSPSYSDASDAAQNNISEMWNFDFWATYIDHIARYRYNFISCWNLHPFPSLVRVPEYSEIALADVHKSIAAWDEYYSLGGQGLDAPEILDNYDVIKKMSIEEKITFWRNVMSYGKSRNVDFYFITWNIFVNGTDGKYGITTDVDNITTRDYFRKSVSQLFRTYPDLAGIGLTTGENMKGVSFEEKENWAYDTYAQGILDVAREMPNREFTFIHRQHQADPKYIEQKFEPLIRQENIEFIYSFKYAKAHVFSATKQPYHEEFVENIGPLKTIWTLRNDDAYYFRWGAPEFVREFIKNIPYSVSRGMYYGSDQWIWGRDFTTKKAAEPRQLEIAKHWYHWMLWGRLTYDPEMSNSRIVQILQTNYPDIDAGRLYEAWQEASMVYPVTTGFHWGRVDFMWYIEGCRSRPHIAQNATGFHDVNTFISFPVHEKSGNQSIPQYVELVVNKGTTSLRSPIEVSDQLHAHADKALRLLSTLQADRNEELDAILHDIKTIAFMGKYYAHKIAGSTYVALYRETKDKVYQDQSIAELTDALAYWKEYVNAALERNINPIWTNRVGHVDWTKTTEWVEQDIAIAKVD